MNSTVIYIIIYEEYIEMNGGGLQAHACSTMIRAKRGLDINTEFLRSHVEGTVEVIGVYMIETDKEVKKIL